MGIFTWTDAAKKPEKNKYGDYKRSCIVDYDGYAKIVCPDNTVIEEYRYNGYGRFNGIDAYDLVAEWNRKDVPELIDKIIEGGDTFPKHIYTICKMYGTGASDDEIEAFVKKKVDEGKYDPYMIRDWKRNIGIAIACEHNDMLKFPLKVTSSKKNYRYDQLRWSDSCQ